MPQKEPNNDELCTLIEAVEIIFSNDAGHNNIAIKILKGWISSDIIENSKYQYETKDIEILKSNWVRETTERDDPKRDPHKIARVLLLYICKNYLNIEDEGIQSLILDPVIITRQNHG